MRTIPIAPVASEFSDCEESGVVPKQNLPLARREFLKGSGILMGTLAAGSVLAGLAPSTVWAVELKTLSKSEGETLMAMARVIYPHKKLPDAVYAILAKDLDGSASGDPGTASMLREGIGNLHSMAGGDFRKASPAKKLAIVKGLEGSTFFGAVRGQCVTSVYNNDMAFAAFGYPGSAWEKGGYITRGFQDLKWLPAPSKDASPAAFMG
ncbi:MAG: hypothetical protein RLZZ470_1605 [Pseudomonadota bacterium]